MLVFVCATVKPAVMRPRLKIVSRVFSLPVIGVDVLSFRKSWLSLGASCHRPGDGHFFVGPQDEVTAIGYEGHDICVAVQRADRGPNNDLRSVGVWVDETLPFDKASSDSHGSCLLGCVVGYSSSTSSMFLIWCAVV